MQAAITQAAIYAATMVLRATREENPSAKLHTDRRMPEEHQIQREATPMMSQPVFNLKVPNRYVKLLSFEMEAANVLQTEVYDISEERKVPILKNWLGREGIQFIQTLTQTEKGHAKAQKDCLIL